VTERPTRPGSPLSRSQPWLLKAFRPLTVAS
jgi:hypothetical protein